MKIKPESKLITSALQYSCIVVSYQQATDERRAICSSAIEMTVKIS